MRGRAAARATRAGRRSPRSTRHRLEHVQRHGGRDADALPLAGVNRQKPSCVPIVVPCSSTTSPVRGSSPLRPEERAIVVAGEEARLLALGALRDRESRARRFRSRCVLVLLAEREPDAPELLRVETREHVRLILRAVGTAMQEHAAAMLRDTRIVAGRKPVAAGAPRKREQLGEAEAAVAADARIRRLAARVSPHERRHDRAAKLLAQVERDVRKAEPVARLARRDHGFGRAAGPVRVRARRGRARGEASRRSRSGPARSSATALSTPPLIATAVRPATGSARKTGPIAFASASTAKRLAADRGSLEQRQPGERTFEPGRIRLDDAVAVDAQTHRGPLAVARRVSERLDHSRTVARRGARHRLRDAWPIHPADSSELCEPGVNQVGSVPFVGNASVGTPVPFM